MIKRFIVLVILCLICSGCKIQLAGKGEINQAKLYDDREKYAVVLFRGVFFDNVDQMEMFYQADKNMKLMESNDLYVNAMPVNGKFLDNGYLIGGTIYGSKEGKEKEKLFSKTPRVVEVLNPKLPTFKPEYFYTLKMLPEGEYYISIIRFRSSKGDSYLESIFHKEDSLYHFTVKAGKINYLGDFYLASPIKDEGYFSKYNLDTLILNESDRAKAFMENYHSDIKLPFATNLMQKK